MQKTGTCVTVHLPNLAGSIPEGAKDQSLQIARGFAFLNPHLSLSLSWRGEQHQWLATNPQWGKWKPSNPTCAHWHRLEDLERLIAAYLTHDAITGRKRSVRDFLSEFRGFSGSAKQKRVLDDTGLARQPLTALATENRVNSDKAAALLEAMKAHSKPVPSEKLGIIGKAHMEARCKELGAEMESFCYGKQVGENNGLPRVIETAFAWRGEDCRDGRILVTGVNWSASLINPFRELGRLGESLDTLLAEQRVYRNDPVIFMLHVACPRITYSDRGKSSVVIGG